MLPNLRRSIERAPSIIGIIIRAAPQLKVVKGVISLVAARSPGHDANRFVPQWLPFLFSDLIKLVHPITPPLDFAAGPDGFLRMMAE